MGDFNAESQFVPRDDVTRLQVPTTAEPMAVDRQRLPRSAPKLVPLSNEQHLSRPVQADDVVVVARAKQAGIRKQYNSIHRLRRSVIAQEIKPRGQAEGRWLSKPQTDAATKFDQCSVREGRTVEHFAASDSGGAVSLQQVALTSSHDRRVLSLQVGEDRQVCGVSCVVWLRGGISWTANREAISLA